jgi:hypothetical protein
MRLMTLRSKMTAVGLTQQIDAKMAIPVKYRQSFLVSPHLCAEINCFFLN